MCLSKLDILCRSNASKHTFLIFCVQKFNYVSEALEMYHYIFISKFCIYQHVTMRL